MEALQARLSDESEEVRFQVTHALIRLGWADGRAVDDFFALLSLDGDENRRLPPAIVDGSLQHDPRAAGWHFRVMARSWPAKEWLLGSRLDGHSGDGVLPWLAEFLASSVQEEVESALWPLKSEPAPADPPAGE